MTAPLLLFSARPHQREYFARLAEGAPWPSVLLDRAEVSASLRAGPLPGGLEEGLRAIAGRREAELVARGRRRLPSALGRRLQRGWLLARTRRLAASYLLWLEESGARAVGVWNGGMWHQACMVLAARHLGLGTVFFENGLLPRTTTIDPRGVNDASSVPRDPEFYRAWGARSLRPPRPDLVQRPSRTPLEAPVELPPRYVFVPFQIESDTQLLLNSPWLRDMEGLVDAVLEGLAASGRGDLVAVFKEHPSSRRRFHRLRREAEARGALFASGNVTRDLIEGAQGVVTINSTVGLEALLLRRPVLVLGRALYRIPGVAAGADDIAGIGSWLAALGGEPDGRGAQQGGELVEPFLDHLAHAYCVPGDWRQADAEHLAAARARVGAILAGTYDPRPGPGEATGP